MKSEVLVLIDQDIKAEIPRSKPEEGLLRIPAMTNTIHHCHYPRGVSIDTIRQEEARPLTARAVSRVILSVSTTNAGERAGRVPTIFKV